ncbi:MAG: PGF-pre-PGF domain-containing protein [Methanoregula sp.]|nr:PGF-pre-PGF domain-containing protein [Methanoregula sp.]
MPTRSPRITITVNAGGDSSVYQANVTGTGLSGLILTGFVASGPGQGIPPAPETVYEYVDLFPARFYTIEQANISFTVPQSWLDEYHLTQKNIMVYHLTNTTWTALPTTLVKTETVRSYYISTSPGFSRFAITGNITFTSGTLVQAPDSVLQASGSAAQAAAIPVLSAISPAPTTVQTTETPGGQTATRPPSGLPETIIGMGIAGGIILAGLVMLVRRWWIRKQNPLLFRDQK